VFYREVEASQLLESEELERAESASPPAPPLASTPEDGAMMVVALRKRRTARRLPTAKPRRPVARRVAYIRAASALEALGRMGFDVGLFGLLLLVGLGFG
jgi:hypothetical protein